MTPKISFYKLVDDLKFLFTQSMLSVSCIFLNKPSYKIEQCHQNINVKRKSNLKVSNFFKVTRMPVSFFFWPSAFQRFSYKVVKPRGVSSKAPAHAPGLLMITLAKMGIVTDVRINTAGDNAVDCWVVMELRNGAGLLQNAEIRIGQHVPNTLTALIP